MLKNYLKVALRNLIKNKSYVIINTLGLGIALACCITSYILVAFNIEFDDFHADQKVGNVFRIHSHVIQNDAEKRQAISAPLVMGPMTVEDFAGVKSSLRCTGGGANVSMPEKNKAFAEGISYADSTLFDFFDFPLVAGNHEAFKSKHSIFIDKKSAVKYFGDEDPIGQVLTLTFAREVEKQFVVGGVLDKIPVNNSLPLEILIRFEHFEELRKMEPEYSIWGDWNVPLTFVQLEQPEKATEIATLFDKYIPLRNEAKKDQRIEKFTLEPFKSKVDRNDLTWSYINTPIEIEPLMIFITLAVMILLIACFNLTNTSIAMTAQRLKEVGIRKSIGASKRQIISQFIIETTLIIFSSLIVGYGLSLLIVPEFTAMWDLPFGLNELDGVNLFIALMSLVFFASLLAGVYPALFSNKFSAVALLKGNVKVKGSNTLTRVLVSIQFAISVIVLVAGVMFIKNATYQNTIEFGYDKSQIVTVNIQSEKEFHALEAKARTNPKIKSIGVSTASVGEGSYKFPVKYDNVDYDVQHLAVGKNYLETMGFTFIQGRPFDTEKTNDFKETIVVSREFLKTLNIQGDPIGQQIMVHQKKRKIVGVIEDFVDNVFRSGKAEPFVFYPVEPGKWSVMAIKAEQAELANVNEFLETTWKNLYPTKPFSSRYQEDILLAETKKVNGNLKKIFLFLTVLGGLLSASGIFSLASLNIAKRTKEIGIRKALGASVSNILMLLNREFVIILSAAGIMGCLGGYYGTDWMLGFIYKFRADVTLLPTVLCAILIFMIGMVTTSFTIFKAAKANPVDTLRDE